MDHIQIKPRRIGADHEFAAPVLDDLGRSVIDTRRFHTSHFTRYGAPTREI
jgi:hypothetical protein